MGQITGLATKGKEFIAISVVLGEYATVDGIIAWHAPTDNHIITTETKGATSSREVTVIAEYSAVL